MTFNVLEIVVIHSMGLFFCQRFFFRTARHILITVLKTSYHGVNAFPVKDGKEFLEGPTVSGLDEVYSLKRLM